ncbi:7389_t:CDS:2, partial [Cetraspora pellucida]
MAAKKYVNSSDNTDKSSDDDFIKIDNLDDANLSIKQLCAIKNDDFQDQDDQDNNELSDELDEELVEKKKILHLQDQKKLVASKTVTDIVNGRFLSKSLLYNELVSLQVASYLHSKKFKIDSIIVKDYFEQEILPFLNIESVQSISGPEKEQLLRKKSLDAAMHISNFLTKTIGQLKNDQEEACIMMV